MELTTLFDRAVEAGRRRPAFDPRQRMSQAAEQLNRAGTLQAQIGVVEGALVALINVLYATDADGQPANYDAVTGRILIPLPWGSSGWKHWGLRKMEAQHLRRVLLGRAAMKRPAPLFAHDYETHQWFVDNETYPAANDALLWVQKFGPQLGEWRTIVHAHREAEAERLRAWRAAHTGTG